MAWIKYKPVNDNDQYMEGWMRECEHVYDEFNPRVYFENSLFEHSKVERLEELAELEKDRVIFRSFSDQLHKQLDAGTLTEEQYLKLLLDYQCRDK